MKNILFKDLLTLGLEANLQRWNPWWEGKPQPALPMFKRWAFSTAIKRLRTGPAKITVLTGPRQVGKSTLMHQIIQTFLDEGMNPRHIFHVPFDELEELSKFKTEDPILRLSDWFEKRMLQKTFNEVAREGKPAYLFLDEVQNLERWAPQLKNLVDTSDIRVMVTGSSALRIELGRDSLAGRISTVQMGPLFLREILGIRGQGEIKPFLADDDLSDMKTKNFWLGLRKFGEENKSLRDKAFMVFSQRGAYPVAHAQAQLSWKELSDFLNETVIKRAIQHDLRFGRKGTRRDANLLEEVFRLSCRYIGQSPRQSLYMDEIKRALTGNIGWQRILTYLKFLDGTLLIRLIEPLELRLKKRRSASKLCLCDHALRASWLQEVVPLDPEGLSQQEHLRDIAGHISESAAGYFLKSLTNLDVAHFPERLAEPEVDFVLTIGEQRIPLEVKYRSHITWQDTRGLRSFIEKSVYNAPFGILVTLTDELATDDPRLISIPLSTLLLMR